MTNNGCWPWYHIISANSRDINPNSNINVPACNFWFQQLEISVHLVIFNVANITSAILLITDHISGRYRLVYILVSDR